MAEHHHSPRSAAEAFPPEALAHISETIAEIELATSAEIRVAILEERDFEDGGLSLEDVAHKEFKRLGMQKTAGRSGVLLLVIFEEHKFYIFGDTGIHQRVDPETWTDAADAIGSHFRRGDFKGGVVAGLKKIKEHLHTVLPPKEHNPNELSNEVVLR
jgi:uncharacterized membrane protein